jgi:hypothetical protein
VGRSDRYVRRFPEATGEFTAWIDLFSFAQLSLLIQNQGFASIPVPPAADDVHSSTVSVTGRINRSVAAFNIVPIQLWSIQQAIDSVAMRVAWKRM